MSVAINRGLRSANTDLRNDIITLRKRVKELEEEQTAHTKKITFLNGEILYWQDTAKHETQRAEAAEKEKNEWREISYKRLEIIAEWSDKCAVLEAKAKQLAEALEELEPMFDPTSQIGEIISKALAKEVLGNE
jgi:chromosome segregation ATPase